MAELADNGDPRLNGEADVRPIVAPRRSDRSFGWIAAAFLVAMGLMLFFMLDARRRAASTPAIAPGIVDDLGAPAPVAPLFIPTPPPAAVTESAPALAPEPDMSPRPAPPPPVYAERPPIMYNPPPQEQHQNSADPALVIDTPADDASTPPASGGTPGDDTTSSSAPGNGSTSAGAALGQRVGATVMHHRATTVPQGTLIPATLESALDSTRPGLARALVSSDVRGFDGSRVLIPRGSRLIGEYHADIQPGQNRALVTWTRLIRPDGVTIAIGSPAADPLGQIGIKGSVDSHFLSKFGAAILQSALDIGVNLASRSGNSSTTVLALPSTVQSNTSPLTNNTAVQPTLRVREGAPITVFVAHDLDFTAVEGMR